MSSRNTFDKKVGKRSSGNKYSPGSYDYSGLAHWWAYNYGYKHTGGGRMTSDGNKIKSYTTVIGRMLDPAKKGLQPFVLLSSERYSNTTATHMRAVLDAVSHMDYMFISNPDPRSREDHILNLQSLLSSLEYLAEDYHKKRKDSTRNAIVEKIMVNKLNAEKYASYFKLKRSSEYKQIKKYPLPTDANFTEFHEQSVKSKMRAKARADARRARRLKKDRAEKSLIEEANLKRWLNGENVRVNGDYLEKVYMRISGDMIETTSRVTVGLNEVTKAYLRFKKGTLKEGMKIGSYTYGGIDEDNNAHIGCHVIPLEDIDAIIGVVIAERAAYIENDQRIRQSAYDKEMDMSFDEIMGELKDCFVQLDKTYDDIITSM